jgi:hypothetical protein
MALENEKFDDPEPSISEGLVWKWIDYAFPQKRNQRCDEVLSTWDIRPPLALQPIDADMAVPYHTRDLSDSDLPPFCDTQLRFPCFIETTGSFGV